MSDVLANELATYIKTEIIKQPNRELGFDEPLITSGLIDSFSLVDLSIFIEDSYGVRIEDTELNADTFNTLNELVALILERRS